MTTPNNLLMVERLQHVCAEHGMKYSTDGHFVKIHADSERYKAFSIDNTLFAADSVETCLGWLTGVSGGFTSQLVERKPFTPKEAGA